LDPRWIHLFRFWFRQTRRIWTYAS